MAVFKQSPSLAHLQDTEMKQLAGMSYPCKVTKGDYIFMEGDPPLEKLYIVQSGKVKLFKETPCGKIHTFKIAHCGDTLHGVVLFTEKPCWMSAQAMDKGSLLCLNKQDFRAFVIRHPDILMKVIGILDNQISTTHSRLMEFVSSNVKQRLLNVLSMLYIQFGETLPFTNEELAELAGTTTETTIRIMGRLKRSGLIDTRRGTVCILDKNRLSNLSTHFIMV